MVNRGDFLVFDQKRDRQIDRHGLTDRLTKNGLVMGCPANQVEQQTVVKLEQDDLLDVCSNHTGGNQQSTPEGGRLYQATHRKVGVQGQTDLADFDQNLAGLQTIIT